MAYIGCRAPRCGIFHSYASIFLRLYPEQKQSYHISIPENLDSFAMSLKDPSSTSGKEPAPAPPIVRRSKTMPTDSPSAKFLYTIIKQLDLKGVSIRPYHFQVSSMPTERQIDWNLVASQLEISNGHAARMRYHRFRNQMEGIHSTQRKRASTKPPKSSINPLKAKKQKEITPEPTQEIKAECKAELEPPSDSAYKTEPHMKTDPYLCQPSSSLAGIPQYEPQTLAPPYPNSQSPSFPPSIATPYQNMHLTPEFCMYSPMPPYPPVPDSVEQGYQTPIEWTPVQVGSLNPSEEYNDIELVETPMKKEWEGDDSVSWNK